MPRLSRWRWGLTWAAGCLFLIDLFGVVFHQVWVAQLDQALIHLIRQPLSHPLTQAVIAVTTAGNPKPVTWVTIILVVALVIARRYRASFFLLINVLGWAGLGNFILKNLVQRPRPTVNRLVTASSFSFPSGHSITVMLLWGTVIVLAGRYLRQSPGIRYLITGLASLWILAVGVSRVYVGVHYPTDVLAGWLLGFFLLTVTQWFLTRHGDDF